MRATIPAALAMSLLLGATPVVAQDEEPTADAATDADAATQRAEAPALGLAMEFPAEWRLLPVEGERESAIDRADGTPVMETTAFYANGGDGTWCDVDAWLDIAADSELEAFAFSLVTFMQETEGPDAAMMVTEEELSVGPAYRIEVFDQATGGIRGLYLFDGPARADSTFDRFLLTCAAREFGEPFWTDIANSTEFFEPVDDGQAPESTDEEDADADAG